MDDYTWQQKIQERKLSDQRTIVSISIIVLAALFIGTALWYFLIYARTPAYALRQIQSAVEAKDAEAFARYVNLDVLTTKAYDDLTLDLFAYDASLTPKTKTLFEKFYVMIKPQLSQGMADSALTRVRTGSWQMPEGKNILKGRQLGIDYERFLERTQLMNTTLLSIGEINCEGRTAEAALNIRDDYTQTEFTLLVNMEQHEDGHWQVAYIKNYRAYLDAIAPLHNKDIASYIGATEPIITQYNTLFTQQQSKFKQLAKTKDGHLSSSQLENLQSLIEGEIIPSLQDRQKELAAITVPPGATYLSKLRTESTDLTIAAWKHFIKGLNDDNHKELETAETLHKRELEVDLRIEDIIKHTAVSKNIPNIP